MIKKTHTPFLKRSRHERKKAYISIKNKINKAFLKKGRLFYTYDNISRNANAQWADIYFLSKKNGLFYNATIETTNANWHNEIDSQAGDIAWEKVLPSEIEKGAEWTNGVNGFIIPAYYDKDGKSLYDNTESIKKELINNKTVFVKEHYEILKDFYSGIGLNISINKDSINEETVNQAILKFWQLNEQNWEGIENLSFNWIENINFSVSAINMDDEDDEE